MQLFETLAYAFFVGLLPALIWLWFWLHEDKEHPEPRSLLAFTFITGMAMVFLAIPLESIFSACSLQQFCLPISIPLSPQMQFFAWAGVEEILKFGAVFVVALQSRSYDEPLDAIIYMMCAALGFAALENTLFILNNSGSHLPLSNAGITFTVFLTNLRFIGANLLHVVASSTIGIALALSFYKSRESKIVWTIGGLCAAIILHTTFNLFIIRNNGASVFLTFATIWLVMIGFLLIFEKVKKIKA